MRRLFSLWKVLRQHCVFTQLYTLPPCFSSPDLCYHVPGRNLIKWHQALLSLPLSPSPISVSDSNSVSGRSGLPLISSVRSHLWAALALSPPALALSFILLLKWPANRQVWFNLRHPLADALDRAIASCDSAPRNEEGAGFYSRNIRPPCLATSCSPLILCSYLTEPKPSGRAFLHHTFLKIHFR